MRDSLVIICRYNEVVRKLARRQSPDSARTHFGAKKTIRKPDLDQVLATIDVPNPNQRNGPRFGNLDQPTESVVSQPHVNDFSKQ
jgi:hypothetical protein